ncbi:MAG: hypothetical protein IJ471_04225 [Eubacterium sp.]|nr:hypothetical protein [Eubacterium sp.]
MRKKGKKLLTFIVALAVVMTTVLGTVPAYADGTTTTSTATFGFRWAGWNDTSQTHYEDTTGILETEWGTTPGGSPMFFYYVDENGNETRIDDVTQLASSDMDILQINADENIPGLMHLSFVGFGEATVNYTTAGTTYQVKITVGLPQVGLYTTPTASQSSYIFHDFTVTDTVDTFYLVGTDNWKITSARLEGDLANIANITVAADQSYAAIKVTGTPSDGRGYNIVCDTQHDTYGTNSDMWYGLQIKNGKPSLMLRYPDGWNNGPVENTNNPLQSAYSNAPGYNDSLFFYYVENGAETRVLASELISSNENVVKISADTQNPDAVMLEMVGFGNATISYDNNGVTYSVDVVSDLPSVGLYSSTTASQATYISEFTVTDSADTFYLVGKDDWKITSATLDGDFGNIASIKVADDQSYAAITVTGTPESGRGYGVRYSAKSDMYNSTIDNNGVGLNLINGKPSLMFRWSDWNNNVPTENKNNQLSSYYSNVPGNSDSIFVYYVENGNETLITADALKSGDENVVKLSANSNNADAVALEMLSFGETTINYTDAAGKTYSIDFVLELPLVGMYSSTSASESTYIKELKVTDDNDTFYVVGRDDWKITDITLLNDFANIANSTISTDGTYAIIEVTGIPQNDRWYEFECSSKNDKYNNTMDNQHYGIKLYNGKKVDPVYDMFENWTMMPTFTDRINPDIHYLDEYGMDAWAEVTDVQVTGGNTSAVDIVKTTNDEGTFWAVYAKELGTAEVTITHTNPNDASATISHTFPMNVVPDMIGHGHKMLSGNANNAFPGDVVQRELIVNWDHYDETTGEIVTTDISDTATFNWYFATDSANFACTSNGNVGTITVAKTAAIWEEISYGCDITYVVDGNTLYTGFSNYLHTTDAYPTITANPFPTDFGFEDTAVVTPTVQMLTYDYATGQQGTAAIQEDVYLEWYTCIGDSDITLYRNGEQIPYGMSILYDANDVYTAKRGACFDAFDVTIWVEGIIVNQYGWEYFGRCDWSMNATSCPHPSDATIIAEQEDATCTEAGYTGDSICTICNEMLKQGETIPALGHKTELQDAKDVTCTVNGFTGNEVCTVCEETIKAGEVITAPGHTTELRDVKAATCTEDGYTGDTVCTTCKETLETGKVIVKLGHTTEVQGVKAATCTEDGYTGDTVCTTCKETLETGKVIAKLGHTTEVQGVKAATCTVDGYTGDIVCTTCKETIKAGEAIKATGHAYTTYVNNNDATCQKNATGTAKCDNDCGTTDTKELANTTVAHKYTQYVDNNNATCTTDATKTAKCNFGCNVDSILPIEGTATGHSHTSTIKPATCTAAGEKVYTCACGDSYSEVLNPNGHIYQAGSCTVCQTVDASYKPVTEVESVASKEVQEVANKAAEDITTTVADTVKEIRAEAAASGETVSTEKLVATVKEALVESNNKKVKEVVNAVSDETLEKVIVAVAEEKEISTKVVIMPVEEDVIKETAKEDVKKIEAFAGDHSTVAQYLDLYVLIQAEDKDGNVETLGTIDEPTREMTFTLSIPAELRKDGRNFYIIFVHDNGDAERINAKDNGNGTVSFKANKFSTYALAYTDASAPQTGDIDLTSYMWAYILIMICGAVLVGTRVVKRRYF